MYEIYIYKIYENIINEDTNILFYKYILHTFYTRMYIYINVFLILEVYFLT